MRPNRLRQIWRDGGAAVNGWLQLPHGFAAEVMAAQGWDSLTVDLQHGPLDYDVALTLLQALSYSEVTPLARVPWNEPGIIMKMLDAGCYGIICPMVNTAEQARQFVAACRYPPAGMRGVAGGTRATRFARVKDYAKRAHEEICVLVQVENQQGLDNLEKIAAVEGVDGVFIGPADLHASLGYPGETNNPKIMPVIDDALRRIRKAGKAPGILTGVEADARRWLECGGLFVAVGADTSVLARETEKLAAKFR